jgi:hypothetical protein
VPKPKNWVACKNFVLTTVSSLCGNETDNLKNPKDKKLNLEKIALKEPPKEKAVPETSGKIVQEWAWHSNGTGPGFPEPVT